MCSLGAHYFQPHFMPIYSRAFFDQNPMTIHKHGCLVVSMPIKVHPSCYKTTQVSAYKWKMVQGEIKLRNG